MSKSKSAIFFNYGWRIVIFLGSALVLIANFLPWPCFGDGRDCTALWILDLTDSWLGPLFVASILLLPIYINLIPSPFNYAVWCLFWYLIYLLAIARLNPFYMDTEIWSYSPFIMINVSIIPAQLVMRLSLLAVWLAIRPKNLQRIWRFGTIATLTILIVSTIYFFIVLELVVRDGLLLGYYDSHVFGSGALLMLIGGVLLLMATIFEPRNSTRKV